MTAGERNDPPRDPLEEGLRRRLRIIAGATFVGLVAFLVIADTVGRFTTGQSFRVSEFFFGSLIGAVLLIAGVEGASRFLRK